MTLSKTHIVEKLFARNLFTNGRVGPNHRDALRTDETSLAGRRRRHDQRLREILRQGEAPTAGPKPSKWRTHDAGPAQSGRVQVLFGAEGENELSVESFGVPPPPILTRTEGALPPASSRIKKESFIETCLQCLQCL